MSVESESIRMIYQCTSTFPFFEALSVPNFVRLAGAVGYVCAES